MDVSSNLKDNYDNQYKNGVSEWRMLGAKGKAQNIINIAKGLDFKNVLDVGSGDGSVLYFLDKNNFCSQISSLEISQSGVDSIKSRKLASVKNIQLFDGYKIPFEDNEFDLVTCSHVIEHVEYPRKLIREIKRVSKNQIFEIPIDFSLKVDKKVKHFLSYGHINIYSPHTFRFLLSSEGLDIINFKNLLYNKEIHDFINRDQSFFKKTKTNIRNGIWKSIPFFMSIKPNITIVLTQKTDGDLKIM